MEKPVQLRVRERIKELQTLENPLRHKDVRCLEGKLRGHYRLRVGEYHLVFGLDTQNETIAIHAIVPRGHAY